MIASSTIARCTVPGEFCVDRPDAHFVAIGADGMTTGRCSVWWANTPTYQSKRVGYIGHLIADNAVHATILLERACEELAGMSCQMAVGPVNGSTWRSYRLVTHSTNEPPFFLEPSNPPEWPTLFQEAGFNSFAHYSSALEEDLHRPFPGENAAAEKLAPLGLQIRPLDLSRTREELGRIFALSVASFGSNLLFQPTQENEFVSRYEAILAFIRPELVLLAEYRGELIGFLFAIPDHNQAHCGESVDTVIIKTLAIAPSRAICGLGRLLVGHSRRVSRRLGYKRMIHAMMHDDNKSHALSARCARTIRRYAIFSKNLHS